MVPWPAANQPAGRVTVSRRGQALGRAALFVLVLTAAALLAWKLGAFVTYALKLTRTPHAVVKSDLEPLRGGAIGSRPP